MAGVLPEVATRPRDARGLRRLAFVSGLVGVPFLAGSAFGAAARDRQVARGLMAGAVAALALGALRWQLARWFTREPAYELEARRGTFEVRRYPARSEVRAEADAQDLEAAMARGFGRLACYVYGANARRQDVETMSPVITAVRDGRYEMSFVLPPDRARASLPAPSDPRIVLRDVPAHRLAVLRFRGRFTRANIEAHEHALVHELVDADLAVRGSVMFAAYDSPWTLPFLRRNELWIELA